MRITTIKKASLRHHSGRKNGFIYSLTNLINRERTKQANEIFGSPLEYARNPTWRIYVGKRDNYDNVVARYN